jgi:hypothetical protein
MSGGKSERFIKGHVFKLSLQPWTTVCSLLLIAQNFSMITDWRCRDVSGNPHRLAFRRACLRDIVGGGSRVQEESEGLKALKGTSNCGIAGMSL